MLILIMHMQGAVELELNWNRSHDLVVTLETRIIVCICFVQKGINKIKALMFYTICTKKMIMFL